MSDEFVLKPYDVSVALDVPRDEAWDALTRPAALREWFGWDYDGLDAEIEHIFVTAAARPEPYRMDWADGSYLEVTGDDTGCLVRAARGGPPPDDARAWDAIEEGWRAFLIQLRHRLGTRPAGARRTVYLTGEATGRQVLALTGGEWHRAGSYTAWTLDERGHLVVASARTHLDGPVAGRAEVTVSTYGLDDAAFAACRAGWADRWAAVAAGATVTVAGLPAPA